MGTRNNTKHEPGAPTLAVIVVTYNSAVPLPGLLDSLAPGLEGIDSFEVIIVDNDSRDDSVDIALAHPVGARVVKTGSNAGYATAINKAAATVHADADLLILNPDLRLCPGAALRLVTRAEDASVGIAVPRNFREDGTTDPTLRREPSIATAWADSLLGGKLAGQLGLGEIVGETARYDRDGSVEWATGSVLLVAARARRAVGIWDESYFLYSEEVDYQRRVRAAGHGVSYVPESQAVHAGGEYRANTRLFALLTINKVRYYRRYHGVVATCVFRLGIAVGEALRFWRGATHRAALYSVLTPVRPALDFRAEQPR
jgi:N-acetylglucosaminyl-diphospho-decaprenol L-rhamnosyltransferase